MGAVGECGGNSLNKTPEKTKRFQTPCGVLESFLIWIFQHHTIFQHPVGFGNIALMTQTQLVPVYLSGIWKHQDK